MDQLNPRIGRLRLCCYYRYRSAMHREIDAWLRQDFGTLSAAAGRSNIVVNSLVEISSTFRSIQSSKFNLSEESAGFMDYGIEREGE